MKSEITYVIYKNNYSGDWVLQELEESHNLAKGTGGLKFRGIFTGSKKECQEKKMELVKSERTSRKIRKD